MKGYKVFGPNWICRGKKYAVGETATQDGELELCENGIHFCTELADCFCYYSASPRNRLAEVEALGEILQSDNDSKCCTDKLKVVKELSIAELLKDKDFCLEVAKRDPSEIRFMKDQVQEVYLAAVEQDGCKLIYVPENMKTEKICMAAVKQDGLALKYVPNQTMEICLTAVQQDGMAFEYVRRRKLSKELRMAAVKQNGMALQFMQSKQTPELCLAAVEQNGWALEYVIEQTPEICMEAVRQDPDAVYCVRDRTLRTQLKEQKN